MAELADAPDSKSGSERSVGSTPTLATVGAVGKLAKPLRLKRSDSVGSTPTCATMKCEMCEINHYGNYGTGRFCSSKCARGFSTKAKRQEINKGVSIKLRGRKLHNNGFKKGFDPNRKSFTEAERNKGVKVRIENLATIYATASWEDLPHLEKRRRIIKEQENKCSQCSLVEWQGLKLVLELHHKDGNHENECRNNLEFLCPNCHSLTPNYRNRKITSTV